MIINSKTKILFGILIVGIIVIGGWWILTKKNEGVPTTAELKTCSMNSDCILVKSIKGLDHIPVIDEGCGCKCITSINKKFKNLWEQKRDEFKNVECKTLCKPCTFFMTNSRAECKNLQCIVRSMEKIIFENDCDKLEKQIDMLIESANYCDVDSDCVISTEFWCPFGCYNLFNKNTNLTEVREGIEKYHKNCPECIYDCNRPPTQEEVICKNNKCIDSRYEK